jgi:hypothetical protein
VTGFGRKRAFQRPRRVPRRFASTTTTTTVGRSADDDFSIAASMQRISLTWRFDLGCVV